MQYILKTSRKQANKNIESLDKREREREREQSLEIRKRIDEKQYGQTE
jgi:hypothetical protein